MVAGELEYRSWLKPANKPSYRNTHIIIEWAGRWYEVPLDVFVALCNR